MRQAAVVVVRACPPEAWKGSAAALPEDFAPRRASIARRRSARAFSRSLRARALASAFSRFFSSRRSLRLSPSVEAEGEAAPTVGTAAVSGGGMGAGGAGAVAGGPAGDGAGALLSGGA